MATKLTSAQRLDRAHVALLRNEATMAMAGILMMGQSTITTVPRSNPTALTDGLNKRYDDAFVQSLSDAELRAVVAHENLHVMFKHTTVWRKLWKQNARKANIAADFVVNSFIKRMDPTESFLTPPRNKPPAIWLYDVRFDGLDVGEVYRLLPDSSCQGGGGKGQGQCQPGQGEAGSEFGNAEFGDGLDGHDWTNLEELTQEEREKISADIDQAIRQGLIMAGKVAGKKDRTFDGLLEPKVDWRKVLREFITTHCDGRDESTWKRPNRRWMQYDIYMPSMQGVATGEIGVGIDTSGSIGGEMLQKFMSEVNGICTTVKPDKLHLLYWDAAVAAHEEYSQAEMGTVIAQTKPAGGGGTAPSCVTEYMRAKPLKPKCMIMATDGYVGDDWGGHWPCPVLWVIIGNKGAQPSTGVVVHAED